MSDKHIYTINTNEAEVFLSVIYDPFLKSFKEKHPDIKVNNIVDDSLLNDTRDKGGMTTVIANRVFNYAKAAEYSGADGVLVTCTSVNKATKMIRPLLNIPILNIEEPVAEMAVASGTKIGVLATIPTSPKAISDVIREKAAEAGKEIDIIEKVADGAFDALRAGNRDLHDQMVNKAMQELADQVDCIAFAQISMSLVKHDPVTVPVFKIGMSGLDRMVEMIDK